LPLTKLFNSGDEFARIGSPATINSKSLFGEGLLSKHGTLYTTTLKNHK